MLLNTHNWSLIYAIRLIFNLDEFLLNKQIKRHFYSITLTYEWYILSFCRIHIFFIYLEEIISVDTIDDCTIRMSHQHHNRKNIGIQL